MAYLTEATGCRISEAGIIQSQHDDQPDFHSLDAMVTSCFACDSLSIASFQFYDFSRATRQVTRPLVVW